MLSDGYRRLSRHKGKAAAYFIAVMTIVVVVTTLTPPEYRSESKLFVRLGRENVGLDPTTTMGQGGGVMQPPGSREDEINSVVEMLDNRVLREGIVDSFGPDVILGKASTMPAGTRVEASPTDGPPTRAELERARQEWSAGSAGTVGAVQIAGGGGVVRPRDRVQVSAGWSIFRPISRREQALDRVNRRLSVAAPRKSNVITIGYDASSPALAQAIVSKLVELYLEQHVRLNRTAGSHDFFVVQATELHQQLVTAEKALRDLKDATGLTSAADQRKILVDRIGALEDEMLETESQRAVSQSEVRALATRLQQLPAMQEAERASGFANEAADGMRQQLYTLQLKEQDLLSKYADTMPAVQEIRRQIREAQQILNREDERRTQVKSARNPAYEQLNLAYLTGQATVTSLGAKTEALRNQLAAARLQRVALNDNEMRLTQTQRQTELQEAKYRRYAETLEQSRVDQALELQRISNISVVQPATFEERPVRPRKLFNLAGGLLIAVFGCVGLVVVADALERSPR